MGVKKIFPYLLGGWSNFFLKIFSPIFCTPSLINWTVSYSCENSVELIFLHLNCIKVCIWFCGYLCYNQQQENHIEHLYQALVIHCAFLSTIEKQVMILVFDIFSIFNNDWCRTLSSNSPTRQTFTNYSSSPTHHLRVASSKSGK